MKEYLDVVNENDQVARQEEVEHVHQNGLLHRSVHAFIVDSQGRLFCRQRKLDSPRYPGYWSTSIGAHVPSGETYNNAVRQALQDTLGIDCPLRLLGKVRIHDRVENEWNAIYIGHSDDAFEINTQRIEGGKFFAIQEIIDLIARKKVTPHLIEALKLYQDKKHILSLPSKLSKLKNNKKQPKVT